MARMCHSIFGACTQCSARRFTSSLRGNQEVVVGFSRNALSCVRTEDVPVQLYLLLVEREARVKIITFCQIKKGKIARGCT